MPERAAREMSSIQSCVVNGLIWCQAYCCRRQAGSLTAHICISYDEARCWLSRGSTMKKERTICAHCAKTSFVIFFLPIYKSSPRAWIHSSSHLLEWIDREENGDERWQALDSDSEATGYVKVRFN